MKDILNRLGIVEMINSFMEYQPEIGASYATLAQVVIINRLSFDPQPLYLLPEWAKQHGIDQLLGIDASWLDNDRLGAMMESLANHATMLAMCKTKQSFLGAHPWTDTAKAKWEQTWQEIQSNSRNWIVVDYAARNSHLKVHYPKPRPVQRQILDILATLHPNPFYRERKVGKYFKTKSSRLVTRRELFE